ncbi:MAG: hypothetical protein HY536_00105 [Candidatus Colwellbacteria bacterium]|nr:hypothetical protein [Candidatus Colwellbacteria bacterium]
MKRGLALWIGVGLFIFGLVLLFRATPAGAPLVSLLTSGGTLLLPLVTIAALIDSVNPCAFSLLFLTVAFRMSIGRLRSGILALGGAYVAGIFVAYMSIGLGILGTLHLFDTPHFMGRLGALLLIALGVLGALGEFFPSFPISLRIPHVAHRTLSRLIERASFPTAFALGALVGICEFPCTGGPYALVLGLLRDTATYAAGFAYLLWYNALFVLPLLVVLFIASDKAVLEKIDRWHKTNRRAVRLGGSALMVALGLVVLFVV